MATARPIRMLGAACILLTLFLIFNMRQSSNQPNTKLVNGMTRDPLLDREFVATLSPTSPHAHRTILTFKDSDGRTGRSVVASRRT